MSTSAERIERMRETISTGAAEITLKGQVYKLAPLPLEGIKYLDEFGHGGVDVLIDLILISASQIDPSVTREEFAFGIDFSNMEDVRNTLFEISGIRKHADPKVQEEIAEVIPEMPTQNPQTGI